MSADTTTRRLLDDGFCVVDGVLDAAAVRDVRRRLVAAAEESRRRGVDTFMPVLDPNDRNVRVFNLLDLDPVFVELIQHPRAIALVRELLGDGFLIFELHREHRVAGQPLDEPAFGSGDRDPRTVARSVGDQHHLVSRRRMLRRTARHVTCRAVIG